MKLVRVSIKHLEYYFAVYGLEFLLTLRAELSEQKEFLDGLNKKYDGTICLGLIEWRASGCNSGVEL